MQVIGYVQQLFECKNPLVKPEHIGIISPYHQQVRENVMAQCLFAVIYVLSTACISLDVPYKKATFR